MFSLCCFSLRWSGRGDQAGVASPETALFTFCWRSEIIFCLVGSGEARGGGTGGFGEAPANCSRAARIFRNALLPRTEAPEKNRGEVNPDWLRPSPLLSPPAWPKPQLPAQHANLSGRRQSCFQLHSGASKARPSPPFGEERERLVAAFTRSLSRRFISRPQRTALPRAGETIETVRHGLLPFFTRLKPAEARC